ncbi:threonyl-tRNA synthetase [Methanobrevibacter arboriphilus JCM 13429 = DSM 1125]|uniref:Threonine--tRNA ligase n=1 Tax=Methanobrevibacter arboriphilus JCM 13429 = DSM 1125 TaxID=1300164 RepID=A0A1V6N1N8_METAZ|nr:threonine--tRNA ligase [Methanobrevibacter arboriphilus]OQD58599.1 threonyl-tRNA synthetase [Methanobrevibacter arboriphilus JCM 13429 = DSM 1125]
MRVLLIHSDYLKYKTKNKTPIAEEIEKDKEEGVFNEALVVFTAVEKVDEKNPAGVVNNLINEIKSTNDQINAERIVLYPYAHLSSSLSSPKIAIEILKMAEKELSVRGFEVSRVPFGWYKSFEISCKGHPLSELSRSIDAVDISADGIGEEESEPSKFYILEDSILEDAEKYKYEKKSDLEKLAKYELGTGKSKDTEPPHVRLMKEKELADYESAADVGHLKWYPKGRIIRDLLSDYVYDLVVERGAMPIETPVMYDLANDAIREHAEKFGERQYKIHTKKELMLRFACCFGAFRVLADSFLTWKNLPARVYELSTYSFRFEKRGEVVGLKRLRGFTMPDMHSICADMSQSLIEFENQVDMCIQTGKDFEVNYEVIFRATKDFYEENQDWMYETAKKLNKPVILEILPERKHYWVCKMDFAAMDYLGRPIENPTVQIDVESGKRFDISYLNENEKEDYPIILHCSPTGSIERVICSLLEKTAIEINEKPPMLPIWLSPIQVRVIPVGEKHLEYANQVADEIAFNNIRVDVDDRDERVGKKIRNAATDWVPYTIVIGDKEIETNVFNVTIRETKNKCDMELDEVIYQILSKTMEKPFRKLPIPRNLSERINFK